ncbi:MAG: FAD-dependent oxidoreductase [Proteiniphilum sp.]|uniref:FAD-dependent oxidoreductase n=1 Tax=Proteiniphilum sp. TaxID=1926877 RepID=UPI002ABA1FD3|nr:FAD-dependent oxidoreductase [Proteiniphilum sp.]MDY9917613.1 FAD-dependent oxidoreductase [Proteiniphilum sp.]
MDRRNFITYASLLGGSVALQGSHGFVTSEKRGDKKDKNSGASEMHADVIIIGAGMGGCAAALASCRNGLSVIMTEETDWIGGQVSQQGVPPDEHQWIETHGAPQSYRDFRNRVRDYYRRNYPLIESARTREHLNPGDGSVSRLCHEPRVAVSVLTDMLSPYLSTGKLQLLFNYKAKSAGVEDDRVTNVEVIHLYSGDKIILTGNSFVDATECGDLLPLTGTEYVTGTESKHDTGELHAPEKADPMNNQAFTVCFAMDYQPGKDNVQDPPKEYDFWKNYVPEMTPPWSGRLLDLSYSDPKTLVPKKLGFDPTGKDLESVLNLWNYRRIINRKNFIEGTYDGDITIVNWPQNDFFPGNLIDVPEKEFQKNIDKAKQLSHSLFYWLQTEAPRADGGVGWRGLRLRGDIMGTEDGMAKYPYIREARRIKAEFTVLEEHVGAENRKQVAGNIAGKRAADFYDSIGIGYYHIDLHPSSRGNNYVDFSSLPFQIPLGSLLPKRINNLLPANKNIGTTHITNGCYRLHPVEWSIGEAVGCLIAFAGRKKVPFRAVRADKNLLSDFQKEIERQGIETKWPE